MIVDQLSIAYQTAKALAVLVDQTARALPLGTADALKVRAAVYLTSAILAPRITAAPDVATIGRTLVAAIATIRAGVAPSDAAPRLYQAAASAAVAAPVFSSPALTRAGAFGRALAAAVETAFLANAFVAETKTRFGDRQSATAARNRISAAMDGATDRIASASGLKVFDVLNRTALLATDHIATVAVSLRPIVRVETGRSTPSTALAYELYGDPSRATELVARNAVACSIFMPTKIEALAS